MKKGFSTIKPIGGPRDPRHGTIGGYSYWGCRCFKCLDANLEAQRRIRADKLANLRPEDHGRQYTYTVGCRCDPCTTANRQRRRTRNPTARGPVVELSTLA